MNERARLNALRGGIVLIGAAGMIGQLLLIRVLMVVFYGNELSLGIVITGWLLFEAAGAYLGGRGTWFRRAGPALFVGLLLLYAVALPAVIVLARLAGGDLFRLVPGQAMGLGHMALTAVLTTLPAALLHGSLFPLSAQMLGGAAGASSTSRAYLIEIVGAIGGGLVFVFALAPHFTALQVAVGLLVLHLALVAWLLRALRGSGAGRALWPAVALAAVLALALAPALAGRLHRFSVRGLWPEGEVTEYVNTPYGNVAVLEREGEHAVFYDGRPIISLPHPDTARLQDYAWLAALSHPRPERVLALGGGLGGLLSFLLEHPLEELVYTELDPHLPEVVRRLDAPVVRRELADPRTRIVTRDGRLYLNRTRRRFDLIVLGDIDIETLQANRFFTEEFFRLARGRLTEGGVLAFSLPGSLTYLGGELGRLNACIYHTAGRVFEHVLLIPGDHNIMLASEAPLHMTAQQAARRLEERDLMRGMFTGGYLAYRLEPDRIARFTAVLEEIEAAPNRDFRPAGLFYGLRYWGRAFAPRTLDLLAWLGGVPLYWHLAGALLLAAAAWRVFFRSPAAGANRLTYTVGTSGVAAMSFDLFTLFAFQSLFGYVYQLTGLFIAAFMGGMFLGGRLSFRRIGAGRDVPAARVLPLLLGLDGAVIGLLLGFVGVIHALRAAMALPAAPVLSAAAAVAYAVLSGAVVGAQFPAAVALMPAPWRESAGRTAGRLYTADLAGGCLGGLGVTLLLFPLLGLAWTLALLAALKLTSLALLARAGPRLHRTTGAPTS